MSKLKQLVSETHKRSLWQVLLIYVGAAWACFELIDTVTDRLGLPVWLPGLAIVLFLLALPVVLATAFVREHDLPTVAPAEGSEAETVTAHREARRRHLALTWRNAGLAFMAVLAVWGVVAAGWILFGGGADSTPEVAGERPSLAALPFVNRSGLEEDAYFTDGIHDEILTHLSKISGLSVRGRTSVMRYRDTQQNLREIGEELNARYILEGGVQRAGATVRVNLQLVDAESDEHVWAETYDRPRTVENLLGVQSEVARRVAEALKAVLTTEEAELIERRPTDNLEAYDYYLRAQAYDQVIESEYVISQQLLERAIELDPSFALAHTSLGRKHLTAFVNWDPSPERLTAAKAAIDRAFAIHPDMPEAYAALGVYYYRGLRDWDRAIEALGRAERGLGCGARVCNWLGLAYRRLGRLEEAGTYLERQVEHDPLDSYAWDVLGTVYNDVHRYAEAERAFDRAIALRPDYDVPYFWKAWNYLTWQGDREKAREILDEGCRNSGRPLPDFTAWAGRVGYRILREHYEERLWAQTKESVQWGLDSEYYLLKGLAYRMAHAANKSRAYYDSARTTLRALIEDSPENPLWHADLATAYAGLGRAADAIQEAQIALDLGRDSYTNRLAWPLVLAEVYVTLGERELAIEQIDDHLMPEGYEPALLRLDPIWDPLRGHPRFQALLAKSE